MPIRNSKLLIKDPFIGHLLKQFAENKVGMEEKLNDHFLQMEAAK